MELLRELRPELDEAERRDIAWRLAAGFTLLVLDDEFERLDPARPIDDLIDPLAPDLPDADELRPREPKPHHDADLTYVDFEVLHESGVGFPGAQFEIVLPSGASRTEVLDGTSRFRAQDIPKGVSCTIRFADPLTLSKVDSRAQLGEFRASREDTEVRDHGLTPITVPTGRAIRLVVSRAIVPVLQLDGAPLKTSRSIVLPSSDDALSPLTAIASALAFAAGSNTPRSVVVAVHANEGDDDLSSALARNAELLLRGDASAWAGHCMSEHTLADVASILTWVARTFGWPCDPGAAFDDERVGAALGRFRERLLREHGKELPREPQQVTLGDWHAFFELYATEIAAMVASAGSPGALRGQMQFAERASVGCGTNWKVNAVTIEHYPAEHDGRLDILFFDPLELPDFDADPPGRDIYGTQRYRAAPIPVRPWKRTPVGPAVARLDCGLFPGRMGSGLVLPGPWTRGLHPIPHLLAAIVETRSRDDAVLLVVGHTAHLHGEADALGDARAETIRCLLDDDVDGWVRAATDTGALTDIQAYLGYLEADRGWSCHDVESFQREYNERFEASIYVDGICGEQTLGAVFTVLRDELSAFSSKHGIAAESIASTSILYRGAARVDPRLPSLGGAGGLPGLDLLVVDRGTFGDELTAEVVYDAPGLRFREYAAFCSDLDVSTLHVEILSVDGAAYAGVDVVFTAGSEVYAVVTNDAGVASVPHVAAESFELRLPTDLRLPHPRDVIVQPGFQPASADLRVSNTPTEALHVAANRKHRVLVGAPPATDALTACHFLPGSAFPAETMVFLADELHRLLAERPGHRLVVFGHAQAGIGDAKAIADRRARLTHATLIGSVDELLAIADEDAWTDEHFLALLGFLGVEPHDEGPAARIEAFQRRYAGGDFFDVERGRGAGDIPSTGTFDDATKRAVFDAYVAAIASDLTQANFGPTPWAGCAEFNPPLMENAHERVTVAVFGHEQLPASFPCTVGDAECCEREQSFGGKCRFYRQRVGERSAGLRVLRDDETPAQAEGIMVMGARLLSGPGFDAVSSSYGPATESVADGTLYAFREGPALLVDHCLGGGPVLPRVHWVDPAKKRAGPGKRSARLPLDRRPDGSVLRPEGWSKSDNRTLGEIFDDLLEQAFVRLSGLPEPAPTELRGLLKQFDPVATPTDVRAALETLTLSPFDVVSRHVSMAGLLAAGQALNPEVSTRYLETSGEEGAAWMCNIYATDFVGLLPHGAWLPKVSWAYPRRVAANPASADRARIYAISVTDVNRFLTGKLGLGGERFGWFRIEGDTRFVVHAKAQDLANDGVLVVMSGGSNKYETPKDDGSVRVRRQVGHVAVVVPEQSAFGGRHVMKDWGNADREYGRVYRVLRSSAGWKHGTREGTQVLHPGHHYLDPGFFFYDPARDESRGTDVIREPLVGPRS